MENTIYTNKNCLIINVTLFKIELKHYIEALKDVRNKKAQRMYGIFESFSYGNIL